MTMQEYIRPKKKTDNVRKQSHVTRDMVLLGDWEQLQDAATTCHVALEALRNAAGAKDAKVTDICKIYFKTNFISL